MARDVFVVGAKRTPIGKFLGAFSEVLAAELGGRVVEAVLQEWGLAPADVDELIFGHARQAGNGPNIARQIVRRAGLSDTVPAFTVNKACASSLKAIVLAWQAIALGDAEVVVAGGTESMSRVPFLLENARMGYRLGHADVIDGMYQDGFLCPLCGEVMGATAEHLVDRYGISRSEQDEYAVQSQERCERARKLGRFTEEIVPLNLSDRKGGTTLFSVDEHPRDGVTIRSLSKLPPVFRANGTVHAGNSSGIADGAAALMLMSGERVRTLGIQPMARVMGYTSIGCDPKFMGLGPVRAIRQLESRYTLKLDQFDLVELNEAFAAQVLACDRELHLDRQRLNVNGGAIALGHPIGATGARIVVTLLHEMKKRDARHGLATLCVSGGLGMAVAFEKV